MKVSKDAKIRNRYNQVPQLTQNTNGKVTNSQLDTTNESQEVSPFPVGDHKAHINRRAKRHSKYKTEKHKKIHKRSTALERSVKYFTGGLKLIKPPLLPVFKSSLIQFDKLFHPVVLYGNYFICIREKINEIFSNERKSKEN